MKFICESCESDKTYEEPLCCGNTLIVCDNCGHIKSTNELEESFDISEEESNSIVDQLLEMMDKDND